MSPETAARWLALAAAEHLDMVALGRLHSRWPDPAMALSALCASGHPADLRGIVGPGARPRAAATAMRFDAAACVAWLAEHGDTLMGLGDPDWPTRLQPPDRWPAALTVRGSLPSGPAVSVVGMRRCSAHGAAFARSLAADLATEGVTVVSGLAFGIDVAAHRGCLEAGGRTVAVLAGGLARVSPRAHADIAAEIVAGGGALLSHVPPQCDSPGWRFPVRNRLVAGMADVVVVVEAAARGGALSTARHARDVDRVLLAVPGSPWDEHSVGTDALLADGAEVCRHAGDVLVALGLARAGSGCGDARVCHSDVADLGLDAQEALLLAQVEPAPTPIDDVARRADLPLVTALACLGRLEMAGLVSFPQPATVVRVGRPQ